jgi:Flp pilus assembly protein TadB
MKPAVWFCAAVATALAAAILYWYGISLFSVLVALILLACPVWVIWMSLRLSRQTRR